MNEITWDLALKEFTTGVLEEQKLKEKILAELKSDPYLLMGLKTKIIQAHSYNLHSICDRSELAM